MRFITDLLWEQKLECGRLCLGQRMLFRENSPVSIFLQRSIMERNRMCLRVLSFIVSILDKQRGCTSTTNERMRWILMKYVCLNICKLLFLVFTMTSCNHLFYYPDSFFYAEPADYKVTYNNLV